MIIVKDIKEISSNIESTVLSIGNFDGIHLGHKFLINQIKENGKLLKAKNAILTFDPHPMELLNPEAEMERLVTIERKIELLQYYNLDILFLFSFDETLRNLSPYDFVEQILVNLLKVKMIIIGSDFRFGHNRVGDINLLIELGKRFNFIVGEIHPVKHEGHKISSSQIRNLIRIGDIKKANLLLGRPYEIEGVVIEGYKVGRSLGFPTANLAGVKVMLPAEGVYSGYCIINNQKHKCAIHIGERATLDKSKSIETYIFDFKKSIYGSLLRIHLMERIRDIKKFDSLDDLKSQIEKDVERIKKITIENIA